MAQNVKVCDISEDVKTKLKKFRFRKEKNVAAILMKVDTASQMIVMDGEELTDVTIDELREELPEHQPRYLVISYVRDHGDGRTSYPLVFIYLCPSGIKTELCMMYAGSRNLLQKELGLTKVFEIRDLEDFTDEWLNEKLSFFK